MSLVSFMSESMSVEQSSLMFNPLANIVRSIIADANGAMLDPSDMTTLYQDAAGTTPVTAVEQPVGKILDKSGNGNHATQSVTASRPTLSARKNLLLATETLATQSVASVAVQYVLSFYGTGSVTLSGTATQVLNGTGANSRVSVSFTPTAGTLTLTVSGSVTKAQLEPGSVAGPYQRVNTSTDYDTDERYFPKYLRFDGVDDYLNLPYMGLYAAGSASVVAGASVVSASGDILSETNSATNTPFYRALRQHNASFKGGAYRSDSSVQTTISTLSSPANGLPRVVSGIDTGANFSFRDTVSSPVSVAYTRDTTTLSNTTIGAMVRTTTSDYISMNLYGLIITKSALTDSQRIACERYLGRKSGVQL